MAAAPNKTHLPMPQHDLTVQLFEATLDFNNFRRLITSFKFLENNYFTDFVCFQIFSG